MQEVILIIKSIIFHILANLLIPYIFKINHKIFLVLKMIYSNISNIICKLRRIFLEKIINFFNFIKKITPLLKKKFYYFYSNVIYEWFYISLRENFLNFNSIFLQKSKSVLCNFIYHFHNQVLEKICYIFFLRSRY